MNRFIKLKLSHCRGPWGLINRSFDLRYYIVVLLKTNHYEYYFVIYLKYYFFGYSNDLFKFIGR